MLNGETNLETQVGLSIPRQRESMAQPAGGLSMKMYFVYKINEAILGSSSSTHSPSSILFRSLVSLRWKKKDSRVDAAADVESTRKCPVSFFAAAFLH